jgi:uncharacterized protein (DUF1778 family)
MMADTTQSARALSTRPLVQIKVDRDLLDAIDRAATRTRLTRTAWIVQACLDYLPPDILEELEQTVT